MLASCAQVLVDHWLRSALAYVDVRALAQTCVDMRRAVGDAKAHKRWCYDHRWQPRARAIVDQFIAHVGSMMIAADVTTSPPVEWRRTLFISGSVKVIAVRSVDQSCVIMKCRDVGTARLLQETYDDIKRRAPTYCIAGFRPYPRGGHYSGQSRVDFRGKLSISMAPFDSLRDWLYGATTACIDQTSASRRDELTFYFKTDASTLYR